MPNNEPGAGKPLHRRFDICCVVDQSPRFFAEIVLWAICARRHLPAEMYRLIVYIIGNGPTDLVDWLGTQNIEVRQTARPVPDSPVCNIIAPFLEAHDADWVVSTSADLFFLREPSDLFQSLRFRAAANNHGHPPIEVFRSILAETKLDRPYRPGFSLFTGKGSMRETHINNISSAIVAAPISRSLELGEYWKKWAVWLTENPGRLAGASLVAAQVAFALAMEDAGEDVEFLPQQVAAILPSLTQIETPYSLHIPAGHLRQATGRFNRNRTLRIYGLKGEMPEVVGRLNECILEAFTTIKALPCAQKALDKFLSPEPVEQQVHSAEANDPEFDNRTFWDNRYTTNISLGSGIGSRGENMQMKRALVSEYLAEMKPQSILDVGCGDFEVLSGIDLNAAYHGLDVSSVVVERNQNMFPGKTFEIVDFAVLDDVEAYTADVVLNFEVLIHQHTYDDYFRLLRNIVHAARKGGFISGYVHDPRPHLRSAIISWHEPLTETLEKLGAKKIKIRARSPETDAMCFVSFER
jgi:SAM-dependent methyltransferase